MKPGNIFFINFLITTCLTLSPVPSHGAREASNPFDPGAITVRRAQVIMLADKEYFQTLVDFIRRAERSIDISMYIFKITTSPKNKAALLVKELIKARKRGVMIRVILEKSGYDDGLNKENQKTARKLRRRRIKVVFDSEKTTTHTKAVVIDRRYCFIGSHNFTHSALAYNNELSLLIDNRHLAREITVYFDSIRK